MCLTETWQRSMTEDCLYAASPAGYSFISQARSRQRGGGVCIVYRSHIQIQKLFLQRTPQIEIVSMKIRYLCRRFILMCVYKAPQYKDIRSVKKIGSMLKGIRSLDLPVIITGARQSEWSSDCLVQLLCNIERYEAKHFQSDSSCLPLPWCGHYWEHPVTNLVSTVYTVQQLCHPDTFTLLQYYCW